MAVRCTRPPTARFTLIRDAWARDSRLSWKARGLLTYLHSHADGYELSLAQIIRDGTDGKDAVHTGLAELEGSGYLTRLRDREAGGRWGETDYVLADPFDLAGQLLTGADNPPMASVEGADNPPERKIRQSAAWDVRKTRRSGLSAPDEPRRIIRSLEDQQEETTNTLPLPLPPEAANPTQRRQEPAETFEEFWAAYPKKVGKDASRRAWAKAARRADAAKILDVLRRYPFRDDRQFVKDPATWLNAGCWEDDLEAVAAARDSRTRSRPEPYRNPPAGSYTTGDGKL